MSIMNTRAFQRLDPAAGPYTAVGMWDGLFGDLIDGIIGDVAAEEMPDEFADLLKMTFLAGWSCGAMVREADPGSDDRLKAEIVEAADGISAKYDIDDLEDDEDDEDDDDDARR